jgi:hypothetical protein
LDPEGGEAALKTSLTVANYGAATAEAPQLLVAVADTRRLEADPTAADEVWLVRLSVEDLPDLAPGATWTWEESWILEGPPPELTLIVEDDPFNVLAEADEANNAARLEYRVPGGEG